MLSRRSFLSALCLAPLARPANSSTRRTDVERRIIGCMAIIPMLRQCRCLTAAHFADHRLGLLHTVYTFDLTLPQSLKSLVYSCVDEITDPQQFHAYVETLRTFGSRGDRQ